MPHLAPHRLPHRLPRRIALAAAALALLVIAGALSAGPVASAVAGDRLSGRVSRLIGQPAQVEVGLGTADVLAGIVTGRLPRVDVAVTVPYTALPARIGTRDVRYDGARDGMLAVTTSAEVGGQVLPVTVLARPTVTDGRLALAPQEVEVLGVRRSLNGKTGSRVAGALPAGALAGRELPALPGGVTYRSVTATPSGLRFALAGQDVPLDRLLDTAPTSGGTR